jgi:hypothetical protein
VVFAMRQWLEKTQKGHMHFMHMPFVIVAAQENGRKVCGCDAP